MTDRKICRKCGASLPRTLEFFYRTSGGPLSAQCKTCVRDGQESWRKRNPDYWRRRYSPRTVFVDPAERTRRAKEKKRAYRQKNRERINARRKESRKLTPLKEAAYQRIAYQRKKSNPRFVISNRMKVRMHTALSTGTGLGQRLEAALGYTMLDLKAHIERQFQHGMSWSNARKWHIDHIIPVSSFSYASRSDPAFKACWALSNLRPMWAKANQKKADKRIFLI